MKQKGRKYSKRELNKTTEVKQSFSNPEGEKVRGRIEINKNSRYDIYMYIRDPGKDPNVLFGDTIQGCKEKFINKIKWGTWMVNA